MDRYLQILKISWVSALIMTVFVTLMTVIVRLFIIENADAESGKIIPSAVVMMIVIALILFENKYEKKQIKKLKNKDLIEKITKYKSIYTNQLLCYVSVSVVCFVAIFILKEWGMIIFDIFTVLLIIGNRPTQIKVKFDLNLTQEELSKFNHIKFYTQK